MAQDITCTMIAGWATPSRSASRKSSRSSIRRRGELRSHVSELLTAGAPALGDQIKRELHQSIVEVGTKICADVTELEDEVCRTRRELSQSAESVGLHIAAAGTHPFSNWKDQVISPGERYENIVEELQQLARSLLIFGLHIHVAVPDRGQHDRAAERGAVLPAAPAGALDQLPVLAGARHRPEVVPDDRVPALSAERHPRPVQLVERVRGIRRTRSSSCTASTTARRSGGICGRIRSSARWSSASATCRRRRA